MLTSTTTYPPSPPPTAASATTTLPSASDPTPAAPPPIPKDPSSSTGNINPPMSQDQNVSSPSSPNTTAQTQPSSTRDPILASLNLGPVIPITPAIGTDPNASSSKSQYPPSTASLALRADQRPTTGGPMRQSESFKDSLVRRFSASGREKDKRSKDKDMDGSVAKASLEEGQEAQGKMGGTGVTVATPSAPVVEQEGKDNSSRIKSSSGPSSTGTIPSNVISSAPDPSTQAQSKNPLPNDTFQKAVTLPPKGPSGSPPQTPSTPFIFHTPATPVIAATPGIETSATTSTTATGSSGAPAPGTAKSTPAAASFRAKNVPTTSTPRPDRQNAQTLKKKKKKQGALASFFAALGCGSPKHLDDEAKDSGRLGTDGKSGKTMAGKDEGVGGVKADASGNGNALGGGSAGTKQTLGQTTSTGTTQIGTDPRQQLPSTTSPSPPPSNETKTVPPPPAKNDPSTGAAIGAGVGLGAIAAGTLAATALERGQGAGGASAEPVTGGGVALGSGLNDIAVVIPVAVSSETLPLEETEGVTSAAVQPPGSGSIHLHPHHPHGHLAASTSSNPALRSQGGDSGSTEISDDSFLTETSSDVDSSGHAATSSGAGQENQQQQAGAYPLMEEGEMDDEDRLISQGGVGIPTGPDGKPAPLLPPMSSEHTGRKCLVLDLDETLLHSSFKMIPSADFIVPVEIESTTHNVYVIKRPGVDNFLRRMGEIYEVVVFTASLSKYADPVLDILDIHHVVKHRLFRESCYNHKGNYVKDLSQLGREMNTTIIIDNSPASYIFHPNNAVPVSTWFNDPHDTELTDLCPFLSDLEQVDDIRGVLDGSW